MGILRATELKVCGVLRLGGKAVWQKDGTRNLKIEKSPFNKILSHLPHALAKSR